MDVEYRNRNISFSSSETIQPFTSRIQDTELNFLTDLPGGLDFNEWLASHSKNFLVFILDSMKQVNMLFILAKAQKSVKLEVRCTAKLPLTK